MLAVVIERFHGILENRPPAGLRIPNLGFDYDRRLSLGDLGHFGFGSKSARSPHRRHLEIEAGQQIDERVDFRRGLWRRDVGRKPEAAIAGKSHQVV